MPVINWTTTTHKTFTFLEFDLIDGLLRPSDLRDIDLPDGPELGSMVPVQQ